MRFGFQLEVAFFVVGAVIALEGALDIDGVCIVPFDQVAVVAIHRAHEIGERGQKAFGERAPKAGALCASSSARSVRRERCLEPSAMSSGSIRETVSPRSLAALMSASMSSSLLAISHYKRTINHEQALKKTAQKSGL